MTKIPQWSMRKHYNATKGEQITVCDDCGNLNLAHDRAVWTEDGASYCPSCRPLPLYSKFTQYWHSAKRRKGE